MEKYKYTPFYAQLKDAFSGGAQPVTSDSRVMAELSIDTATNLPNTVEEIIYAEPDGNDVMDVFKWFKEVGFGENWILGGNERLFAKNLTTFSQGEVTDFLIWNCIGFDWIKDPKGGFPFCNIRNNLDAGNTIYFKNKIQDMIEMLSFIGNPQISILVPSNEAFDERVWRYRQPVDKRDSIINETVNGLNERFKDISLPDNAVVKAVRWDEFIAARGAQKTPQQYSAEGEKRIRSSINFQKIYRESIRSGRRYLKQNGITNVTNDGLLASRQIMYYGVYAGEGVSYEEQQRNGRNVIIVNFEEMRVSQMAYLGANGNTSFVTPIKWQQMQEFYQWEARQIAKRT